MGKPGLYMCLIGCKPNGRHIEQHDIFFAVAATSQELIRQMELFWPDGGRLHLDAWRRVSRVDGFRVEVKARGEAGNAANVGDDASARVDRPHLYFINLGSYRAGSFEEWHHKLITVQQNKAGAVSAAKKLDFFKNAAGSHIDDQYGVDIDDLYDVEDILSPAVKNDYYLHITAADKEGNGVNAENAGGIEGTEENENTDPWHIGYTKLSTLDALF